MKSICSINLVINYLSINEEIKSKNKIKIKSNLKSKQKIIFLNRQVIKYFLNPEKYLDSKITEFKVDVLRDYDKCSNTITIMSAFYEGGSGNFESEYQKRRTAKLDFKGLDKCFQYAQVDENFFFKNIKKATHAFILDSSIQENNKKFSKVIKSTYDYYCELINANFSGSSIIKFATKLKYVMDENNVCIADPIAQYCFSLLTDYENAKKIFKVKGLSYKSEEQINKILYNSYADLRVLQFINNFESHFPIHLNTEVLFVSNDNALNKFYTEFKKSIKKNND